MLATTSDPRSIERRQSADQQDQQFPSQDSQDPLESAGKHGGSGGSLPLHRSVLQSLRCFFNPSVILLTLGACVRHVGNIQTPDG